MIYITRTLSVSAHGALRASYLANARELKAVAALLKKGKIHAAAEKASSLDTTVRDSIPDDAYDFLMAELEKA